MSHGKSKKGQFFSFDVIAGSVIFLLAFFLLAFYWLNAQSTFSRQSENLQQEAEKVSDLLLSPGLPPDTSPYWHNEYAACYPCAGQRLDQIKPVEGIHLVSGQTNTIDPDLFENFVRMSNEQPLPSGEGRFYREVKEKLGIPKYNYYVTFENEDGSQLGFGGLGAFGIGIAPNSPGLPPPTDSSISDRIVLFPSGTYGSGDVQIARMRVIIWR